VEKLTIALTPEMRAMVDAAVEGGDYASTSEVIREALRDWREKRERKQKAIEELRRMVEEGLASGPARERDIKDIIAEARRRRANNS
jgi:antitoxin ParD1/3/4